ncbi:MAG: hypothetical protein J6V74_02410 [Bacteroidales bacterium]|nr:hypothetical protein [Bacteroidales bacterium]
MKTIRVIFFALIGICMCATVSAQTGSVKTKTTYEVDTKGKKVIDSKEERDEFGRVKKEYVYDEYGDLKKYYTYEYKGKKVSAVYEYSATGKLKEKAVYEYNDAGKKVAKLYYDAAGKLIKKKVYEYTYYAD